MKGAVAAHFSCSVPRNSTKTRPAISPCLKMRAYPISCWKPANLPVEPALAEVAHKLTGGLRLPNDETGDCQLFTQRLARMCEQAGVKFRFNTSVDKLLSEGEKIYGVKCGEEVIKADAYVMAFGSYSTAMLKGSRISRSIR